MKNLYMKYISIDAVTKALDKVGARYSRVSLNDYGLEHDTENFLAHDTKYRMAHIDVALTDNGVTSKYAWYGEEKLAEIREERERIIVELLEVLTGSFTDRDENHITVYGIVHGHTYAISIGEALCERVAVGTKLVIKRDEEAVAEALAHVPTEEVEETVYEWRCSDDILGSMTHK